MSLERLELDVALKLAFVQTSLSKVEEYRQHLQENAQKVKDEIHEIVERQIGALRGRERQLVRQVEVVTAHQTCLLGTQQAGLMHGKGALLATRDLLQRCTEDDTSTLAKIKVDDMDCLKDVVPVNCVSVQLDEAALSSAVSKFGSVQLPDTITHHPSPVIPAKVEEYEDDEHDVLHKSVAGAASGPDSPMRITVQFPRLANQNWLAHQKDQNSSAVPSSKQTPMATKRRKVDAECRAFKDTWTEKYFFTQHHGNPTCLICLGSVSVNKEFNIKRHYETKHAKFSQLSEQTRRDEVHILKLNLEKQGSVFHRQNTAGKVVP